MYLWLCTGQHNNVHSKRSEHCSELLPPPWRNIPVKHSQRAFICLKKRRKHRKGNRGMGEVGGDGGKWGVIHIILPVQSVVGMGVWGHAMLRLLPGLTSTGAHPASTPFFPWGLPWAGIFLCACIGGPCSFLSLGRFGDGWEMGVALCSPPTPFPP